MLRRNLLWIPGIPSASRIIVVNNAKGVPSIVWLKTAANKNAQKRMEVLKYKEAEITYLLNTTTMIKVT